MTANKEDIPITHGLSKLIEVFVVLNWLTPIIKPKQIDYFICIVFLN